MSPKGHVGGGRSRLSPWVNIWSQFILSMWALYTDAGTVGVHVPNPQWGSSSVCRVMCKPALQIKQLRRLLFTGADVFFLLFHKTSCTFSWTCKKCNLCTQIHQRHRCRLSNRRYIGAVFTLPTTAGIVNDVFDSLCRIACLSVLWLTRS